MHDQVWKMMIQNARNATMFYREVFGCIPDDTVTTPPEIDQLQKRSNINKYDEGRGRLKGHAVVFPLDFMKDEDLTFKIGQKEYYVP